ncbi:MAG: cytidine deaminase [Spirochaetales bacterium]
MTKSDIKNLIKEAKAVLKYSYSPYSHYAVSAALLTSDGKIFTGVNIENASYGASMCAERVAVFKAVSEGHKNFEAIAVTTAGDSAKPYPCGICRQVLSEFSPNMTVIVAMDEEHYEVLKLSDILPHKFEL